jgi:adenosylhomocysteine nucleosidase|tara:strand:+ start:30 stop:563 length:534 start_codon:yes stop_codon:yes gene_type:complete
MKYILAAIPAELVGHELDPEEYTVWFTGVGKINAAMYATLACAQKDCEVVINYGTAGTLNPELAGQLIQVGKVMQRDMDARPLSDLGITPMDNEFAGTIVLSNSAYTCSTGDNFVTETPELESDIVDMELYAIAKVCKHFKKGLVCYKYITDLADKEASAHWEENHTKGSEAFLAMT